MDISSNDKAVLRRLVEAQTEIAALPVHKERAELWRRLNDLEPVRPLIWINEIPWHEMNVDDELTLRCSDEWARSVEQQLRRTLYQWRHMPGDMIVDDYVTCLKVIHTTGLGISEDVDIVKTDEASGIVSRHFHQQITEPEDIDKIKFPQVTYDEALSLERLQALADAVGDILPVRLVGKKGTWFAPWDFLIRLWGVQEAMMDIVLRPKMVGDIVSHLVDAYMHELDQWVELNLLTRNDDNTRIGSGAYGYTKELPRPGFADRPATHDLWGSATAQIFVGVSPEHHWEFALQHEMRWLERWGLTYYGCCEPLDIKMGVLRRIPNLRKVSMSTWVDVERGARELGRDYVFSHKPNPAVMAKHTWQPEEARQDLRDALEKAQECNVEVIMKDISTLRYEPQRLWEWSRLAAEETARFER